MRQRAAPAHVINNGTGATLQWGLGTNSASGRGACVLATAALVGARTSVSPCPPSAFSSSLSSIAEGTPPGSVTSDTIGVHDTATLTRTYTSQWSQPPPAQTSTHAFAHTCTTEEQGRRMRDVQPRDPPHHSPRSTTGAPDGVVSTCMLVVRILYVSVCPSNLTSHHRLFGRVSRMPVRPITVRCIRWERATGRGKRGGRVACAERGKAR